MSITVNSVKCPACGGNLPIEEGRTQIFCSFCGTKVLITNENEQIYRHINEASVKQIEADKLLELKRLEIEEKAREDDNQKFIPKLIISSILTIISIGLAVIGEKTNSMLTMFSFFPILGIMGLWNSSSRKTTEDNDGRIKVPHDIDEFEKKSYIAVEAMFKGAGFTNIQCIPLQDMRAGLLKKANTVESITINGKSITSGGQRFMPDATVVISYHSFINK